MTARATFTKAQIARLISGAKEGGLQIGEMRVNPDGSISLLPDATKAPQKVEGPSPEKW
jgi:hypothetical protein